MILGFRQQLSAPQQRFAAVILLAVVLILAFSLVVRPLFSLFMQQGATLKLLDDQLVRYQRLSNELEQTEQQLHAIKRENPGSELYIPETRPTLASAWLQQHISNQVSHNGGQLVSIQNHPIDNQAPLPGIALGVHLRAETDQLVPLFHRLESGKPMLFINELVITSNARHNNIRLNRSRIIRRRQGAIQQLPSLDVRFNLIGYTRLEQQ